MTRARIGHAHLKVRNLDRAVAFYQRVFGLSITERVEGMAFLSGTEAHHELALRALSPSAPDPAPGSVGLYHVAFEVPDRRGLAETWLTLEANGVPLVAVDHGISWALYFSDPDGNGLECYWDTRNQPEGTAGWSGRSVPLRREAVLGG